ncbi:MAG: tetratricopeptide repeat protein [Gemmatimonadota bacterium]
MKIRIGLSLIMALALGAAGCASGGTSGGASAAPAVVPGAKTLAQGERPRQDNFTRAAQRALDDAEKTEDETQAKALYEQARKAAEEAIAADSTNPLGWRLAAMAALGQEDYEAAGKFFDKAEELRPIYQFEIEPIRERTWIHLYQEAIPLVNSGQYEEAAKIFEKANAIYQARPEVMITLGQIYAQLRQHDKALENLDRAMAIIESDKAAEMDSATVADWKEQAANIPLTRAQILADAGRLEEAAEAFRKLAAEHPDDILIKRNLATILVQLDREDEAFQVYDSLMTMPALSEMDYYAIGVGYYQGEAYDKAAKAFGKAAEVSPMDRDAIEMWTRSLQIDSMYAEIPPAAERWIELDPNNQNAYLILAQAVNQEGDEDRARELVMKIESLDVTMDNLQMQRFPGGGGVVTGSLTNKKLEPGTPIKIDFTFYDTDGNEIGTATHTLTAPEKDMSEVFEVEFSSTQQVGGYKYTVSHM